MNRTLKVAAPVGALVAGLVLVPAAPSSAWGLTDVATLAPGGASVVVASDPGGNAAAAWVAGGQVQVARRAVGSSTWTPAVTVSPAGVRRHGPDVSVGPTGVAAVVWVAAGDVQGRRAAHRAALGGRAQRLRQPDLDRHRPAGRGRSGRRRHRRLGRAERRQHDRPLEDRERRVDQRAGRADPAGHRHLLRVVPRPQRSRGDAVAAWRLDGAGGSYVQAARRLNGAAWSAPQAQGTVPSVADAPSVSLDGSGNVALGWGSGPTADTNLPYVATWPRGGNLGGPVGLSAAPARRGRARGDADGRLAAAWSSPSGLMYADVGAPAFALSTVRWAPTRSPSATPGPPRSCGPPPGAGWPWRTAPREVSGRACRCRRWPARCRWSRPTGSTRRWSGPTGRAAGAGPHPRRRAPTAVHLTAPMRVLNAGTLIKAGWIGADTWSPVRYEVQRQVATYRTVLGAAGTWLTTTATDAAYKAEPGRPCACACAAAIRPATSGPGRCRGARRRR